jgi:hypothetical protein
MFLRAKDVLINLDEIQYIRRTQDTITLYFKGDYYTISFRTKEEAEGYLCGLASLLDAKEPEVQK